MSITRPYRRTCRQFVDGSYAEGGRAEYIVHPKFSQSSDHYVRAFLILLKDIQELFDYIEPADRNLVCYSYRIHSMLVRACVEVEANCKAILRENGYSRAGEWNITDYRKIEKTHFLSSYQVKIPHWTGSSAIRMPFSAWSSAGGRLPWYQAYNTTKHDRHSAFDEATFLHLMDAVCGLLVILSAQYWTMDFSPGDSLLALEGPRDGTESAIGGLFRIKFPMNVPPDLRYEFDWRQLANEVDPFQNIDYSQIT